MKVALDPGPRDGPVQIRSPGRRPTVVDAVAAAARRRLFGDTPVRFPLQARIVASYDER